LMMRCVLFLRSSLTIGFYFVGYCAFHEEVGGIFVIVSPDVAESVYPTSSREAAVFGASQELVYALIG